MNKRRFFLLVTIILSVFLFSAGSGILIYSHSLSAITAFSDGSDGSENDFANLLQEVLGTKSKAVNFLIMVGDKTGANTDTMMVVNYHPSDSSVNILSIPRDTKVDIKGMSIPKINGVYAMKNGATLLLDTLYDMLGIKIKYYAHLDIKTFRQVIDELGGVKYNVPVRMYYYDPVQNLKIDLQKGMQVLDGEKAEQFLRFRKQPDGVPYSKEMLQYYDGSDTKRIEAQQSFLKELIRQKVTLSNLPRLNNVVKIIFDNLDTNIPIEEVLNLLTNIGKFNSSKLKMFTLPTKSTSIHGLSYVIYDKEATRKLIEESFKGGNGSKDTVEDGNDEPTDNPEDIKNTDSGKDKPKPTTKPNSTSKPGNTDVTKDNPSNDKTGIEKQPSPKP